MFHLKAVLATVHKHVHSRNNELSNIKFLYAYPVFSDALGEVGPAVTRAVLSLDEHLSQILPVSRNCYQSVYFCIIRYFLVSEHTFCSEYTIFALA
jgi:hypothetical protein